jgi:uncharacterized protein (DUF1810 family)
MSDPTAGDPFDLDRFVAAQAAVYPTALAELRRGRKTTHWIWFVLPQLRGLGRSERAQHYGLGGLAEARAYLAHPLLGPRLHECVAALLALPDTTAVAVLGEVDALKLQSCLTLFAAATDTDAPRSDFEVTLTRYFGGRRDARTLQLLARRPPL